jgi:ribonuclease III
MTLRDSRRQKQLRQFVQKLGLPEQTPVKWELLDLALTHSSISAKENYEQLEFVGDAVVRIAASELLFETYPKASVGEFAAIRSVLVSDRMLAQLARAYGLERYLLLSNSVTYCRCL